VIHGVRSDNVSFKPVSFGSGISVVLAERTKESTKKDSRNGLGKTTLLEVIHFCLGATGTRGQGVLADALKGWTFFLDIDLLGRRYTVGRNTEKPGRVVIDGDCTTWPIAPRHEKDTGEQSLSIREWNQTLGVLLFDLLLNTESERYAPTFRSVISYFIRKGRDAYSTPFEHYRKQQEWDKQMNNAFLLDLSWQYAARWQILKDQDRALSHLRDAAQSGIVTNLIGSIGELETRKVQLETQLERSRQQLTTFAVHPQYRDMEEQANTLTTTMHNLVNENVSDRRMITFYETSLQEEQPAARERVAEVYAEAGVVLPDQVVRRLEDVQEFHNQIIANRRTFLRGEVERLLATVARREAEIRRLGEQRAKILVAA
jgi:uncharacterized protein YydD (DUF2326 family)